MQGGQKTQETSFIDIEVWGVIAENCAKYLQKGSPVVVIGRLKQDRWETEQGAKRTRLKVLASNVQFMGAGRKKSDRPDDTVDEGMGWDE